MAIQQVSVGYSVDIPTNDYISNFNVNIEQYDATRDQEVTGSKFGREREHVEHRLQ